MNTFAIRRRRDVDVPRPHEPRYDYLDRSARTEVIAIRRLIHSWLRKYPHKQRDVWRSRFASGDDGQYFAAFWELYLFRYFSRLGFEIDLEPGSQGGTVKAPDFRMRRGELAFYLEATTAHDLGEDETRVRKWKAGVRGAINAIPSNDFFVSLDWGRDPDTQPASAAPATAIANWLSTLNYAEVEAAFHQKVVKLPTLTVQVGGGKLIVSPIPKAHRRATPGLVGAEGFGIRQVNVTKALRTAVKSKSSRYGDLDLPYVVAINILADVGGEKDFIDGLFGTPQIAVTVTGQTSMHRDKDGAFGTPTHPRARRVSAILCVRDLSPWSLAQHSRGRTLRLIHHPWSSKPLAKEALGLSEHTGGDAFSASEDAHTRLGLISDWPENQTITEYGLNRCLQMANRWVPL